MDRLEDVQYHQVDHGKTGTQSKTDPGQNPAAPIVNVYSTGDDTGSDDNSSDRRSKSCLPDLEDSWWLEVLGLFGAAATLACAVVILAVYDGKKQPEWHNVSLNTVISWLSTLGKAFVLLPVSRNLGQLKWLWFSRKPQSLHELRDFDEASRGVAGSAKLLWAHKW